jgi:TonB family protein
LLRTVILSFAVHLLLAFLLARVQPTPIPVQQKPQTYVELLEAPQNATEEESKELDLSRDKRFVRQAEVPPELLTDRKNSKSDRRFLSERDQTVLEETRARNSGLTANRAGDASTDSEGMNSRTADNKQAESQAADENESQKPNRQLSQSRSRKKLDFNPKSPLSPPPDPQGEERSGSLNGTTSDEGDIAVGKQEKAEPVAADGSRELRLPPVPVAGRGASTVGEQLPSDIKFGNFTALNTDRFLYYSFYARAEELFRHHWVKYVRAALYTYQNTNKNVSGNETWTTTIEIVLDRDGNFQRGILHGSSGLKSLDSAPVQAFRETKQIPNPPPEMVKDDGTIRMLYEFNVSFVPQYASRDGAGG